MTLLREIQLAATDSSIDISTVLRKAKILATRLQSSEFQDLVNRELNGYAHASDLPPYRIIPAPAHAHLRDAYRDWNGAPVMASLLPEKLRSRAEICHLTQPIASITAMIDQRPKSGQYGMEWPQEMAVTYGAKGYNKFECLRAWQIISVNSLVGVVDTVRNRILEFALRLETENPDAGEAPPHTAPVPDERLEPLVHNAFYGPVGNIAQHSERFSQAATIAVPREELGKFTSDLLEHIDELKLEVRQRHRADAQIAILRTELTAEPDPGIVQQAGRTLRNIIEGAVGSLLAAAVPPTVWESIHAVLSKF
jgi:hypothetical protein